MNKLVSLFMLIVALCVGCLCEKQDFISSDSSLARLVAHRTRDFRALFRPEADIERFEKARVCSIEPSGNISRQSSIPVGNGLPLDKVIRFLYGHDYDGQVKVVSRNTIVQTSQIDYDPAAQGKILVRPGDLIFIEPRD